MQTPLESEKRILNGECESEEEMGLNVSKTDRRSKDMGWKY